MDPTQRARVQQLFDRCRELPSNERANELNGGRADAEVAREVWSLLEAYDRSVSFLEEPALVRHAPTVEAALAVHHDLTPGSRVGPFEVVAKIGAGGMGVVYRAHDPHLRRDVAIKLLPAHVAAQPSRVTRFQAEARAIAALNHPNIAALYAVEAGALVMELVPGPTLEEVLANGRLAFDEALRLASQIAEALDAAHQRGIIHRDLKPANIKLADSGAVKVLDFGLAKAVDEDSPARAGAIAGVTEPGVIVGTGGYMSPEQATGRVVDKRTDIWAFGVVLYEMVVGRRLFDGDTSAHRMAAALTQEPDLAAVPVEARRLVKACLEKDPARRLRDIGDWAALLDAAAEPSTAHPVRASRAGWVSAVAIAALAFGTAFVIYARTAGPPASIRADLALPTAPDGRPFALSADGTRVAFVGFDRGERQLSVRDLRSGQVTVLPDTDGASSPFWSPDGRSLGFFADYHLKRIDLDGVRAQVLAPISGVYGDGAWSRDNVIVFAVPGAVTTLSRIDAAGGAVKAATIVTEGQQHHLAPRFLPDGRHFLYLVTGTEPSLWLGSLDGTPARRVTTIAANTDSAAEYLEPGWLIRVRQGVLTAQSFDVARASLTGEPVTIERNVPVDSQTMAGAFSTSTAGPILWRQGGSAPRQLQWVARSGERLGTVGDVGDSNVFSPELSPDGSRVLTMRGGPGESDVWILDGQRNSRVTLSPADDRIGIWSPNGDRVVFTSDRGGSYDLYVHSLRSGADQLLWSSPDYKRPNTWSPDGKALIYSSSNGQSDLMVVDLNGGRAPVPFLDSRFNEQQAAFSPDGRWVAYQSNESGRFEVYLRPFPGPGAPIPVSTHGGGSVRWRRDGRELFYLAPDLQLMSVSTDLSGVVPAVGSPVALFQTRVNRAINKQQYDVSADGRFLLLNDLETSSSEPLRLLVNGLGTPAR